MGIRAPGGFPWLLSPSLSLPIPLLFLIIQGRESSCAGRVPAITLMAETNGLSTRRGAWLRRDSQLTQLPASTLDPESHLHPHKGLAGASVQGHPGGICTSGPAGRGAVSLLHPGSGHRAAGERRSDSASAAPPLPRGTLAPQKHTPVSPPCLEDS